MMTPTCSTNNIDRLNHKHCIQFLLSRDNLLAQDPIVGITIPSSISLPASTLYSFRVITSMWPSHVLASFPMLLHREGPESIYPSLGWTNPTLDPCVSTNTFGVPETTFMITLLRCDVWCHQSTTPVPVINMISWSKDSDASFISYSKLNLVTGSIGTLNIGVSITSFS